MGSPLECGEVLHSSVNCAIWRAAEAMLEHGENIAAVTDWGVPGRPARPIRMATFSGCLRAAPIASSMLRRTCDWRWPDTENAHGSPPDWCQINACMIFGSTVKAQATMNVVRSMVFTPKVSDMEAIRLAFSA
jgi:hypothetical protein